MNDMKPIQISEFAEFLVRKGFMVEAKARFYIRSGEFDRMDRMGWETGGAGKCSVFRGQYSDQAMSRLRYAWNSQMAVNINAAAAVRWINTRRDCGSSNSWNPARLRA